MSEPTGDRVLVTGALGQIGTELVEALRAKHGDAAVIASDIRTVEGHPCVSEGPFAILDVTDTASVSRLCRDEGVTTIYHLAALLSATGEKNPELCRSVNVGGTVAVLKAAKACGCRVFVPSSIAVFGPDAPKHAPQNAPLNPTTVYGETKVEGEALGLEYWTVHGVDVRGLRYPGLVSYKAPAGGGTTDYAVEIFHAAVGSKHYQCFVRPDTKLPMMYMDDAIRATLMVMDAPATSLGSSRTGYNIDGFSFTAEELAASIAQEVEGFSCDYVPDVRQTYADSWPDSVDGSIAKKEWGWSPAYDLHAMTRAMLNGLSD